jgi:PAS domain S-box-containing protein
MSILALDVRTVIVLLVLGDLASCALLFVYRVSAGAERPMRFYLAGKALQAVAWILLALRGTIDDFLSVYVGNAVLLVGFGFEGLAISTVDADNRRREAVFAALTLLAIFGFCLGAGTPNGRVAGASIATIPAFGALAFFLLRGPGRSALRVTMALAALVFCLILVARAWVALANGPNFSLMTPALVQTLAFLPLYLAMIVGTIGFLLLVRIKSDALLRESEEKYRTLVERAGEVIIIAQDERLAFANRRMAEITGLSAETLMGRSIADLVWPEDRETVLANFRARTKGGSPPESYDLRLVDARGEPVWMSISASLIVWKGRPATMSLLSDIDARKRSEARVDRLLAEKEMLLREVHHRVKNNLNVVLSLLSLQTEMATGKDPAGVLVDASNRLRSMVQLYNRLHETGNFESMSVRDFFPPLLRDLASVFPSAKGLRFETELEDIVLDIGRLTTLALLVNEIVTNSLKHAFGNSHDPCVRIEARLSRERIMIACGDNGGGLPEGVGPGASPGLGLQLIGMLASQLRASLRIERKGGTLYVVEFDARGPRSP